LNFCFKNSNFEKLILCFSRTILESRQVQANETRGNQEGQKEEGSQNFTYHWYKDKHMSTLAVSKHFPQILGTFKIKNLAASNF